MGVEVVDELTEDGETVVPAFADAKPPVLAVLLFKIEFELNDEELSEGDDDEEDDDEDEDTDEFDEVSEELEGILFKLP